MTADPTERLGLLALNVSVPTPERARGLLDYLWHRDESVLVLTEVAPGPGTRLMVDVFRAAGHAVQLSPTAAGERGVLVVGRGLTPVLRAAPTPDVDPHRVLTVTVPTAGGPVAVTGVYGAASDPVRYSGSVQRDRKRLWLTAFDRWLGAWRDAVGAPAVLLGDLNLVPPGHDPALRYVLTEELSAYHRLTSQHGLIDAYAEVHPTGSPAAQAVSWVDHTGPGCRYDHAFVTPDLAVLACDLDDAPRLAGLTDHSALVARLGCPASTP